MGKVEIDGYLTQAKLETAIRQLVGDAWVGRERRLPEGRYRWDMVYLRDNHEVAVEFDADSHYRDSLRIKADQEKDAIGAAHGQIVIRFPYWIQLTTTTLRHFFGIEAEVVTNFPHGFVATKLFPASFCELGVAKFQRELEALPPAVFREVVASLRARAEEYGAQFVVPKKLLWLVTNS